MNILISKSTLALGHFQKTELIPICSWKLNAWRALGSGVVDFPTPQLLLLMISRSAVRRNLAHARRDQFLQL